MHLEHGFCAKEERRIDKPLGRGIDSEIEIWTEGAIHPGTTVLKSVFLRCMNVALLGPRSANHLRSSVKSPVDCT